MEDLQAIKEYGFGGKELCRLYGPPKTENPAVQDSFFYLWMIALYAKKHFSSRRE